MSRSAVPRNVTIQAGDVTVATRGHAVTIDVARGDFNGDELSMTLNTSQARALLRALCDIDNIEPIGELE
jgi:hypothetical protein